VHLVGFYLLLLSLMHGTMNLKVTVFVNGIGLNLNIIEVQGQGFCSGRNHLQGARGGVFGLGTVL
jgi:hypothetical protein